MHSGWVVTRASMRTPTSSGYQSPMQWLRLVGRSLSMAAPRRPPWRIAGARSQIAQLAFAGVVLVVLLFLTRPLQYLPRCVLASIVFTIAVGMIDLKGLRNIRRESPGEFYLAVATAAAVVAIGVEQGILLAIALSIFRHVRHSYRPHALLLAPDV